MSKRDDKYKTSSFSRWPINVGKKCVKVMRTDDSVMVQDSKLPDSPTLSFTHEEWDAFIKGVKNDEFEI